MTEQVAEFSCKEECDDDPIELRKWNCYPVSKCPSSDVITKLLSGFVGSSKPKLFQTLEGTFLAEVDKILRITKISVACMYSDMPKWDPLDTDFVRNEVVFLHFFIFKGNQ